MILPLRKHPLGGNKPKSQSRDELSALLRPLVTPGPTAWGFGNPQTEEGEEEGKGGRNRLGSALSLEGLIAQFSLEI